MKNGRTFFAQYQRDLLTLTSSKSNRGARLTERGRTKQRPTREAHDWLLRNNCRWNSRRVWPQLGKRSFCVSSTPVEFFCKKYSTHLPKKTADDEILNNNWLRLQSGRSGRHTRELCHSLGCIDQLLNCESLAGCVYSRGKTYDSSNEHTFFRHNLNTHSFRTNQHILHKCWEHRQLRVNNDTSGPNRIPMIRTVLSVLSVSQLELLK